MRQLKIFTLILLVAFLSSCSKDSENHTVEGDAIIVSKRSGTDVVYGVAFYANSSNPFKTVTVVNSANPSVQLSLSAIENNACSFAWEPSVSEYSTTKPVSATYTFSVVFDDGFTSETQDEITSNVLDPVTFKKCLYNTTNLYAELSWESLTNASSYVVQIINKSGLIVYNTNELSNTVTSGNITSLDSQWAIGYPNKGDEYTIRVYAFEYENSMSTTYKIQSTSISESPLVWGVN
jgi:hypothetical protein